jgi:hypothetical protein
MLGFSVTLLIKIYLASLDGTGASWYVPGMNDHDYPSYDTSHWNSSSASIDEMPPEDFEIDYDEGFELTFANLVTSVGIALITLVLVFGVLT